jgi:hypothetical protein
VRGRARRESGGPWPESGLSGEGRTGGEEFCRMAKRRASVRRGARPERRVSAARLQRSVAWN